MPTMNDQTNVGSLFDGRAAGWDANASRQAMAQAIVRAALAEFPPDARPRLLDYGAGTGLCALAMAPRCASVLAVDISAGMLEQLAGKVSAANIGHVQILQHDLCAAPLDVPHFDVILCAMTLHHIADTDLILRRFHDMLEPGGLLAIADLEAEDGSFHDNPDGVAHHGFAPHIMASKMMAAGFTLVETKTIHRIQKTKDSKVIEYPVFFATGRARVAGLDAGCALTQTGHSPPHP